MGKSKGYIKLYRNILDWELFSDVNARLVFIQLLLTVNYEDKIWQGYSIKRGSRVISYEKFAKEVGLTKRQVRGTIEKLEKARCVARLRFPRFSIISVNNFEKYQEVARSAAPKGHEVGTKSGTETATTKEYNTTYYKEEKKRRSNSTETFSEADSSPSPSAASAASEGGEDGFKKQELKRFSEMGYDF
jgi:hypothetical protein